MRGEGVHDAGTGPSSKACESGSIVAGRVVEKGRGSWPASGGDLPMKAFAWPSTTTSKTRYVGDVAREVWRYDASSDIIEMVLEYAASRNKTSLRILDVGCSKGDAAAYLKRKLLEMNLQASVSGIDVAPEVFASARRKLDRFYEGNIEHAKIEEKHDVVLCARMMRFAPPPVQKRLFAACAERCMPDGVVIADAPLANMSNTYHMVSRDRAGEYGESLIAAWNGMPLHKRALRSLELYANVSFQTGKRRLGLGARSLTRLLARCLCGLAGRRAAC